MGKIPPLTPHDYLLSGSAFQNQSRYTKVPMGGNSAFLWERPIVPPIQLNDFEDTGIENRMQAAAQLKTAKDTLYTTMDQRYTPFGKLGPLAAPPIQPGRSILTPSYHLADTHPAAPAVDEVYRNALYKQFAHTPIISNQQLEGGLFVNTVTG